MTFEIIRDTLGWCALINIGMLLFWWLLFMFGRNFVYTMHSKWFKIPEESFDKIHYAGMAIYKLMIFVFNLVPYLAMRIVG
jgi:hypothetical protein